MIIFLGRRLPGASSDLPEGRNGPGRSVCIGPAGGCSFPLPLTGSRALPPYLVLLLMGFTEPSRSPGLLVSSYLAVSPLPRPGCKHLGRGGLFSVALSLSEAALQQPQTVGVTHHRALRSPDFPPRHVPRRELGERFPALRAQIKAPRRSSRPPRTSLYTVRRGGKSGNLETRDEYQGSDSKTAHRPPSSSSARPPGPSHPATTVARNPAISAPAWAAGPDPASISRSISPSISHSSLRLPDPGI